MSSITVSELLNEKIYNFFNLVEVIAPEEYDALLPQFKNYIVKNVRRLKIDFESEFRITDFKFEDLPKLADSYDDEVVRLAVRSTMDSILGILIPTIGVYINRPDMFDNPVEWFNEKYNMETQSRIFKYLDLFAWILDSNNIN